MLGPQMQLWLTGVKLTSLCDFCWFVHSLGHAHHSEQPVFTLHWTLYVSGSLKIAEVFLK